ncbi:MAG: non-canonical purine NTP pyrophosphatase [Nitrosopumilus sp. D6]|nr:MAG: non-canonical purine NTP pyrophosphatase [Nitrosopumilus sp. D6]
MPPSYDVVFASSNRHKYSEARQILDSFGMTLGFFRCRLEELQSDSLVRIAAGKARDAFSRCNRPVIVEDDGLFIDSLGGFPGPYSSYVFETIGNRGILKLVGSKRSAKFVSVITYCDGTTLKSFNASVNGFISRRQSGSGWGYDPIFVGSDSETFARSKLKNESSHRYRALKKFSSWFLRM